jgi:thioredoxin reductase (NADPH)
MRDGYDVIVIGAGPGGLTAATYLGRFRRRVLVLDGGPSRASWIPESHNTPGFPHGITGEALLARLRDQALIAGADIRRGVAGDFKLEDDGFTVALEGRPSGKLFSRFVVMASGVVDRKPLVAGIDRAIRRALVRVCPICDAYEAIGQQIAVLGDGELGVREASFLRSYSEHVTLLQIDNPLSETSRSMLGRANIEVLETKVAELTLTAKIELARAHEEPRSFDCLYLALGCELQSRLAVRWGAAHDELQNLIVNAHQETSIPGLYAVGDVVRGLNQISVATGEAAIAASHIHKRLREQAESTMPA